MAIKAETQRNLEKRLEQKKAEGLEDQRMMQEYKAKLQREEEQRADTRPTSLKILVAF